ncbi:MAG: HAD family phosphatase [Deltaproteobacteria bacterium]|nr:HAD family phosphatase [Deltaproteobacteria bacterium]MBW2724162.1 HAD family phosphatase [Deltaproteobacteria bacterium]
MIYEAVLFDLGGVVLGSPLHAIADYERELGIPANFINRVVANTAPSGGWARLERGEISMEEFFSVFDEDCRAAGQEISAREMMSRMNAATKPRDNMLRAIERLRRAEFRVAAITNNWLVPDDGAESAPPDSALSGLEALFDVFVESSVEGLRKPDPRIYTLACERLGVSPEVCIFLDDIGSNLKTAREMGIATIKVETPDAALRELESLVDLELLAGD